MAEKIELTQQFRYMVEKTGMTHSAIANGMGITRLFSAVWNGKKNPPTRAVSAINATSIIDEVITYKPGEAS